MASHDTAFRALKPDVFPRHVNDERNNTGETQAEAKVISLNAYKVLRSLQKPCDLQKIHDLDVLLPLINEARLRPVRFYRGLDEWLLENHQDQA
jgi:hypothetical protein